MKEILRIDTVSEHDRFYQQINLHPLVSVIDFTGTHPEIPASKMNFGFYAVYLKDVKCGDIKYGRDTYDYQDRTLVFVAPGQVINVNINEDYKPQGFALLFHPDLIHGTSLGKHISDYTFFSYESREALHLSEKERAIVLDCFAKIKYELEQGTDKHSKLLIAANIELFLNYCVRFYDRQFITRNDINKSNLEKFENLLNNYFLSDKPHTIGLPSVAYCADQLNLSPNYFGDMVKKETGKTALEYIHLKVMEMAKEKILDKARSVSEIAYELGFKYPQHFTRAFKTSNRINTNTVSKSKLNQISIKLLKNDPGYRIALPKKIEVIIPQPISTSRQFPAALFEERLRMRNGLTLEVLLVRIKFSHFSVFSFKRLWTFP